MKLRMLTLIGLAVLMGRPATILAQEREPAQEREVQEAQRRVQDAQYQLQQALEQLRQSQIEEATSAMRDAMAALRLAQRELRADELQGLMERVRVFPSPEQNIVLSYALGRPRMGVLLGSDDWNADTDPTGAVLQAVTPGGPADEAGLKSGDIITKADGQSLARSGRREDSPGDKLVAAIRAHEVGDTLRVEYRRGEETGTANVVLREMGPSSFSIRTAPVEVGEVAVPYAEPLEWAIRAPVVEALLPYRWLNIELVTLDEELGAYFGTSEGLLVVRAPRDDALNLRSGDVILNIDGRKPTDPRHALRIMRSYEPGETMNVEIMRDKRRQTVTVTVPERDGGFLWRSETVPKPDSW